ncbi:hypothetical protein F9278_42230 [Streptomyces phaeolivaceus]|uniref:HTH cro/C1-type domain-containing protein n=1 Tax=Streptomyces phaeolivaceus TaxID=2653200 RepID=A0A5P8KFC2_9ACTN|nr:hypothetical protein [Streptomyces phaeolivaceus]QFR01715.1 hypothetical protein F9278_42230 [Streptomyces phaeolivaceus]
MGRPERPLGPEQGPVQRLAHELRELRRSAGSPSYRAMTEAAGFSAATLSEAARGKRVPSLAVLQGYVRACGGDPVAWEPRWREARAALTRTVRDEGTARTESPYRGLTRFEPADRALFFGRDRLVNEVQDLVCEHRFAVVFGASGCGKSSLLRAGLIPRLQERIAETGRPAALRILVPGPRPATTYGHLLAPGADEPESWVVVDQFEEVFTLCRDPQERTRFIDLLVAARDPASRLRVLIAVRSDFYARCGEHRELADALLGSGLLIGPMTADELREAVVGPAQAVGLLVERELTARVVDEVLDQPGALPMLSHALLETWRRRHGRLLTVSVYEAAGGVRGAIAASAEEVHGRLSARQAAAARRLLLRMVEPGHGTPDTRRPLSRAELDEWEDPDVPPVVERLAAARLLTVDENEVRLAHEALITSWPRLHDWIEEDRTRLLHHRSLTEAARAWLEHDRDPGTLYRGARLARAQELFPDHQRHPALTATERAFLVAAFRARDAEHRDAARSVRRARTLAVTLAVVLVMALSGGLVAVQQGRDNHRRRTEDAARRVAGVANTLRTTDPDTAQSLGVAAWQVAQLPETRRALLGSLVQPELDTFVDPAPGGDTMRYLVDSGRTLLSVDGRVWRTWDVAGHRAIASGRLPRGVVVEGASGDGRLLAVSEKGGVQLWDTAAGRSGQWRADRVPASSFVGFTGHDYLVSDDDSYRIQVRSAADGRRLLDVRAESEALVAPSPDGRLVAVCPLGGAPRIRDLGTGRTVTGAWARDGDICDGERSMLVLGGGRRLAAVSENDVRVWDVRSGNELADLHDPGVRYAAFSANGRFLATTDAEELRVWRVGVAAPVFRYPLHNEHVYGGPAWDPKRPVLRYLEGGTVHTVDLTTAVTPAWQDAPVDAAQLAPDGRTLATARRVGDRYRVELRDTRDGGLLRTLPAAPTPVSSDRAQPVLPEDTSPLLAFAPDGRTLVYGVAAPGGRMSSQRFTVWDVARGRSRTTLDLAARPSAGPVSTLAVGRDARTLYLSRVTDSGEPGNETWDVAHHRRARVLGSPVGSHLALRPDGRLLVGDSRFADVRTGRVSGRGLVQGEQIGAVAFAEDGSLLAAGDMAGRVALWDGNLREQTGTLWNVFPTPADRTSTDLLDDGAEAVSTLAVSPDGRTLAVGGDQGSLQLWDITTQQPLGGLLTTPGEAIESVAFSADSGTLYAASAHVPLQRYTLDPAHVVASVCARTRGEDLTRAQWRTYLQDVPYRRVCGGRRG